MLSYPYSITQQQQQQQQQQHTSLSQQGNQDYLTLSPQSDQTNTPLDLLTSSFDPGFLDDLSFLDATDPLSSSLPSNDHHGWFPFSSQPFDGLTGMNFDDSSFCQSSLMPTIDEGVISTSSMPPPPLLSQSFSPEPTFLSPEYQQTQPQPPQPSFNEMESNNLLKAPSPKGHRRRRSSSVPSLFHSVKKRNVQSSIIPPASNGNTNDDLNQQRPYSAQQIMATNTMIMRSVPHPLIQQQPLLYPPSQQHTKPLPIQIQRNPASHRRPPSPTELNQDQLDERLLQVNFNDVTVAELKDYLRERNLSVAGRKAELTQRLYNERQLVHARRQQQQQQQQQGKKDSDLHTIVSPTPTNISVSTSPPSSVFSSPAEAPSPRPIQQLTHRLHDLDIQSSSFPDYYQHSSLVAPLPRPPPYKLSLPDHPLVRHQQQHQQWQEDGSMPLFYQL